MSSNAALYVLPARHLAAHRLHGPERLKMHIKKIDQLLVGTSETCQTLFSSAVRSPKLRIGQMHHLCHAGVGRNTDVLKLTGPVYSETGHQDAGEEF